ncbi:hypothetical protein GmHk_07G018791 [Glycine max]|nr:hypothetical protein GmHk_07G018791 [Glycine max]
MLHFLAIYTAPKSAAIDLSTHVNNKYDGGAFLQCWTLLYTVDGSTCELSLVKYVDKDGNVTSSLKWMKRNTTTDARGGATETKVYSYGSGNWVGLLVEVCQKNSTDNEEVNAVVILAHYFANSSGTAFNRSTESDIGLSNAISIVNDGRFRGHANGSSIRCKKIYAKGTYPNMSCTPTFVGTN